MRKTSQQPLALFGFIFFLLIARITYTATFTHVYLVWNIFLAWIPFFISPYLNRGPVKPKWKQLALFSAWLLFYPNSLYLVTDLVHIPDAQGGLLWLDIILLFSAAALGLWLAFRSFSHVERFLSRILSRNQFAFAIPMIIVLSSYGVCLGRFGRWNSWDIISSPVALARSILSSVVHPFAHMETWCITGLFSAFFYVMYYLPKLKVVEIKNADL